MLKTKQLKKHSSTKEIVKVRIMCTRLVCLGCATCALSTYNVKHRNARFVTFVRGLFIIAAVARGARVRTQARTYFLYFVMLFSDTNC